MRRERLLLLALGAGTTLALAAGCARTPITEISCERSGACSQDRVCEQGVCIPATDLVLITDTLPEGRVGEAFEGQIEARGGVRPWRFSLAAGAGLPEGLNLGEDGFIRGIPQRAGSATFGAVVSDAQGTTVSAQIALVIAPASGQVLRITTTALPEATAGAPYEFALQAQGGTGTYTWSVASAVLPSGMTLSATGVLSGTPTSGGSARFTVQVTDGTEPPQLSTGDFELLVRPAAGEPLAVVTVALPPGTPGTAYSAQLEARGGVPPYAFSAAAGTSLPSGLSLSGSGLISGTPTQAGTSTFIVRVTDAGAPAQEATAQLSITIGSGTLTITTGSLPDGRIGQAYSEAVVASGGVTPHAFSVSGGTLPPGLQLATDGVLSGTPSNAGTFSFTIQATDSSQPAQVATRSYSLTVLSSSTETPLRITTTTLPTGTTGQPYSAQLMASDGAPPYSWSLDAGSMLPPGLVVDAAGAISGTPTTSGQYTFNIIVVDTSVPQQSASAALSVIIQTVGATLTINTASLPNATVGIAYSQQLAATGGTAPYVWSVTGGGLPPGLSLSTGGLLDGSPTTAGTFNFTVQVADASNPQQVAQRSFTLTVNAPAGALNITTAALPAATAGTLYSQQLSAAGGIPPYAWAVIGGALPAGISLSTGGLLSGTPTVAGSYSFTIQVTDSGMPAQVASRQYTFTVLSNPSSGVALLTTALPQATAGIMYTAQLTAAGGTTPYTFSVSAGSLPPGLTLNASDGRISGTPTASGAFGFNIRVEDASSSPQGAERAYSINVNPGAGQLIITTHQLPPGRVNMPYSAVLGAANGTAPYTWSLVSGTLPAGLALATSGTISGTPTVAGSATFTVEVQDSSAPARTAQKQLSMTVAQ
jgi:hypothetical protein